MAEGVGPGAAAACPLVGRVKAGRRWTQARARVEYSEALAVRLCTRVAAGELLYEVCRGRGMPTPQSVGRWARDRPDFAKALLEARRAGGRGPGADGRYGGGVFSFSEEVADEIFERLCEGESLTRIGRDPTMPSLSTIFHWRRRIAAFEETVQLGMRIRAEVLADDGAEQAEAATPETAYLTQVRLTHRRWHVGVLAPRVFRVKMADAERGPEVVKTLFRHFGVEIDPETGAKRVVAWSPNPETGEVECEDTPGWRPPKGYGRLPG